MASYIEGALINGEEIVYQGKTSWWSQWHLIVLGILTIPLMIGLVFLLVAYIRYKTTELAITTKRVIVKIGLIRRQTIELNLSKVESIQVDQSILGRVFNYGSLVISGAGNPQAPIAGVSKPMEFRKAFMEAQEARSA